MKTYKKLALVAALFAPLFASAQLVTITGPNTSTTPTVGASFHNMIIAMTNDATALYTAEGLSLSIQSPISFLATTTGLPTYPSPVVTGGDWQAGVRAGAINFYEVNNFAFFKLEGDLEIGFIGEESGDPNSLEVTIQDALIAPATTQGPTTLYDYNSPGFETPPRSHEISLIDPNTPAYVQFTHTDTNPAYSPDTLPQGSALRFKVWQSAVVGDRQELVYGNQFLFAITDRNTGYDGDIDDGFFYLTGDITAVPEPSQIAVLAMLGLGGALYLRRRIKK